MLPSQPSAPSPGLPWPGLVRCHDSSIRSRTCSGVSTAGSMGSVTPMKPPRSRSGPSGRTRPGSLAWKASPAIGPEPAPGRLMWRPSCLVICADAPAVGHLRSGFRGSYAGTCGPPRHRYPRDRRHLLHYYLSGVPIVCQGHRSAESLRCAPNGVNGGG
jgi:hypothetical protein